MSFQLGMRGKLYRNTGTYGVPVWEEIDNVKDLTLNLEKAEADVTTRANDGWRAKLGALKDASIDYEMVWDTEDPNFEAVKDAWFDDTLIDMAVMDGDIATSGSQGLRAEMAVLTFTREEPLEEAMKASVNLVPGYSVNAPEWLEVP